MVFLSLLPALSYGQCDPNLQVCNLNECEIPDVNLALAAEGNNVFCEGEDAIIEIDRDKSIDFDLLVYYWCDGAVDTINFDQQPGRHRYDISEEDRCNSSENTYFVTVIGIKNCGESRTCRTVAASLTIKYRPRADFSAPGESCITDPISFSNQSCNEESYLWEFGDGTTSEEANPSHQYQSPGEYIVRLTVTNSCGSDTQSRLIRVVDTPDAAFTYTPDNGCKPATISFNNQSNEWSNTRWSISPRDTSLWQFTDTTMNENSEDISIEFKEPGSYTVRLTATNACSMDDIQEEVINIYEEPSLSLESPGTFCDAKTLSYSELNDSTGGSIDTYEWTFENGSPASFSGKVFPDVTFTESGTITLRVSGPCGELTESVPITIATTEPIVFGDNPAEVCQNQTPVQLQASPDGGVWSAPGVPGGALSPGGQLDPSQLAPGAYTLTYSAGAAECPNSDRIQLAILPEVSVTLPEVSPACETLEYDPRPAYTGDINTYQWTFQDGAPASSSAADPGIVRFDTPGQKEVIVQVDGACGTDADTILIDIQDNVDLTIEPLPGPLCSGSSPDTLRVNAPGGTWSGEGIIDAQLGIFDPTRVTPDRTYTVAYSLENGACSASDDIQIAVVSSQTATVLPDTFCIDSEPRPVTVDVNGGAWSGPGVDPATGVFDPALAGVGEHTATYAFTDPNGCAVSASAPITVEDLPQLSLLRETAELCLSDIDVNIAEALNYMPEPAGGTTRWSGPGITDASGTFNAGNLSEGVYTITVEYDRNDCSVTDSAQVRVILARELELTRDTIICISDDFFQLESNLTGGTWSGPGVDPATGQIDLRVAGDGTFTYAYSYQPGTNCAQNGAVQVEIIDLSQVVQAGADVEICAGSSRYTLSGAAPADGYWMGAGMMDSLTGTIDLTRLQPDTNYVFQYCIESDQAAACSACDSRIFRINSNPSVAFSLDGTACINQAFGLVNESENAVRYEWNFGNGDGSAEASPVYQYDQRGTYTIQLIGESDRGCRDTVRRDLYVTTPPVADFALAEDEGCAPFELRITNNSFGDSIRQTWFINQDTIPGADPGEIFFDNITKDSIFQITLAVENLCGEVRDSAEALVRPYPIVRFGISEDEGCSPLEIEFSNATLGNPDAYEWDLGLGGPAFTDSLPPNQIYTTSDTSISVYTVRLISTNECGADTLAKDITVYPPNVNAFIEMDTLGGCSPLTLQLESYSTPGARVSWRFISETGAISGSEEENPEVTFSEPGRHTIVLFASNCGTDTDTAYVDVLPAPEVDFTHRPYVCLGQPITFENQSIDIGGSDWDFGDGSLSDVASPTHRYDSAGVYTVTLTAYSLINNCPSAFTSEVEVVGLPTAAFTPDRTNGCGPLEINFTNESTGTGMLNYGWNFGDGASNNLTRDPSHIFTEPGEYVVSLTAFDDNGCFADTAIANVLVFPDPVSDFTFEDRNYCLGYDEVVLQNTSTDAARYEWILSGDTLTERSPVWTPTQSGRFPVVLTVENTFGCSDRSEQEIEILESPVATFAISQSSGCEDLRISFDNNSEHSVFYDWDFGNGNVSTDGSPTHTFLDAGQYTVVLRAASENGCPADTTQTQVVVYPKPTADFSFDNPEQCGAPAEIIFDNRSTGNLDNAWSFGDGTESDVTAPIHTYVDVGQFPIRLEVANEFGCRDTMAQSIDIFGRPLAEFDVSVDDGCQPLNVQLTNLSAESTRYLWRIEGLGERDQVSPSVTFPTPGAYDIELVAIYNEQCRDSIRRTDAVRVYQSPTARFTYQADNNVNVIGDVQFSNQSENANRFLWNLGDGTTTELASPYHEYDINRSIDVTLYAYNDNGGAYTCVDSLVMPVDPEWITTFYAPNAFAPEYGEDEVREFRPVGIGLREYEISVYSPWGEQVWHSIEITEDEQPAGAWNGRINNEGSLVPQGAYVWIAVVTFANQTTRTFTGTVTVLR